MADYSSYVDKSLRSTSSGVAHQYRQGYYFPDSELKSHLKAPLPGELCCPDEILHDERFKTTTGSAHDRKFAPAAPYNDAQPDYRRAPDHWKIDYARDAGQRVGSGGWQRPLTMANQCSETHERFRNEPSWVPEATEFVPDPQRFLLRDHFSDGPSKRMLDGAGRDPNSQQRPTSHSEYRYYSPQELKKYPFDQKLDNSSFLENPIKDPSPMRDEKIFKSATLVRRVPPKTPHVPHGGLKSEYSGHFEQPNHERAKENWYNSVDTPFTLPAPGTKHTYSTPGMYTTEYQNVGSNEPAII